MIRWFANNGVAANLVMLILVVGGFGSLLTIKKELFPQFSLDTVVVRVPYLGAAPEEVESGVIVRIEEALQGVDGIKEIRSSASEGMGTVAVEVRKGANLARVKEDIRTRVDAITNLPAETERPIIEELLLQRDVIWVAVYGQASEHAIKEWTEQVRDELTRLPGVSQAIVQGVRDYEISIELKPQAMVALGLTFEEIVHAVRQGSRDVPAGLLRGSSGEILLRMKEQAYTAGEFGRLVLRSGADGSYVRLQDVAAVVDGFVDTPILTRFNGMPAGLVLVREVGDENPLHISRMVNAYVDEAMQTWVPDGIQLAAWADSSFYLKGRLQMLIQNGFAGFLLVLLTLSLFLRPSLAFFVAIGIPVSFLGTFLAAPVLGITINLISLFAFILVLGIVVDDAIVVGESVFSEYQRDRPGVEAAIRGTHAVATPVTYAVLTTMVAFLPVFLLPGQLGKFFAAIPVVVIPTLAFSLIQSKLVLPYHLSLCHVGDRSRRTQLNALSRLQRRVADSLEHFVQRIYLPLLRRAVHFRYLTLALFIAIFLFGIGCLRAGWVQFTPFPSVPSDFIQVTLALPEGTPIEQTRAALEHIDSALQAVIEEDLQAGKFNPVRHRSQFVGFGMLGQGSHLGFVFVEMTKSELRDSNATEVAERWREHIGAIPGARQLTINAFAGPPSGLPIDIRLTGADFAQLQAAAEVVKEQIAQFPGIYDIRDTFAEGKQEIRVEMTPLAALLGLRAESIASAVRAAFYGAEAQRIQRGRDDIRVMVRYPPELRATAADVSELHLRLPTGETVQLREVANLAWGQGFPTIDRIDRRRVINIQADADKAVADFSFINERLYGKAGRRGAAADSILARIESQFPGVTLVKGGEAKDWEEAKQSLLAGVILVAFLIYALLAVPFRSYTQPFIVMAVIPFGLTGAIFGHMVTFQQLSILSMLGIIALAGVVVNDSLVLVDFINQFRRLHPTAPAHTYIIEAGRARFRPVLLTSLTTFAGLVPILLERSLQAQFLIPMATSLGFGILFATVITLFMVPCLYIVLDDCHVLAAKVASAAISNTAATRDRGPAA